MAGLQRDPLEISSDIKQKAPLQTRLLNFRETYMTKDTVVQMIELVNADESAITSQKTTEVRPAKKDPAATITTVTQAIRKFELMKIEVRFDEFRDEIMYSELGKKQWQAFRDEDYTRLRLKLESVGIKKVGKELVRDAVILIAKDNSFDSAIEWLTNVVPSWDFEPRIDTFLTTHFGVTDSPYTRAASRYLWSALAGRVLQPAIKADMVPILIGSQGAGKSTGVAAICPHPDFFTEISLNEKEDDLARKMRGRLLGEISELRGLNTRDVETIKAFVTRTHEIWTPKFKEFSTTFARRIVFIGTTNQEQFLADQTGNRRWLPVTVGKVDVQKIKEDCLQLWAEARDTFKGILWEDAERLAKDNQSNHMIVDAWFDPIQDWLIRNSLIPQYGNDVNYDTYVTTNQVLSEVLLIDVKLINTALQMRVSRILNSLGFVKRSKRIGGRSKNVFVHKSIADTADTITTPSDEEEIPF